MLTVGQKFPPISGATYDGKPIHLESLRGKFIVVYFYPKDDTPGCTIEAKGFSEKYEAFRRAGAEVIGVSVDSLQSHEQFCKKYDLSIPLYADAGGRLAKELGILKPIGTAERTTFLLDKEGKVTHVWIGVSAQGHADEVLKKVKELKKKK